MNNMRIGRNLTEGNILKLLVTFALPLLIGNALQVLQQTINAFWIGRFLGKDAFSAVTVSFPAIFVIISVAIGLTMAVITLVAQYKGAGSNEMVDKIIKNSFIFIMLLGLAASILGIIFNRNILGILVNPHSAPEVFEMASGYLAITFSGLIFIFGFNLISAILRGLGDSWTPLWFLVYATILNALLDPLLILGFGGIIPGLGVNGSALATLISQLLAFIFGVRFLQSKGYLTRLNLKHFKFDAGIIPKILKIGLPTAGQQAIVSTGIFFITALVSRFGIDTVAAFGVGTRIDSFAFMPAMALGISVSALTGQNLGADKKERVGETVRIAALLSLSVGILILLVCLIFPRQIICFFLSDPSIEIMNQGIQYLRIVPFGYLGLSLVFVTNGVLTGAGDTIPPLIFSILSFWLIRIPLAWVLSQFTPLGSTGIWLGISAGFIFSAVASFLYYRFGPWERRTAIRRWA